MSDQPKDGGSAYPGFLYTPGNGHAKRSYPEGDLEERSPGMTLRDYFAGQALTGLVVGVNDPYAAVIARLAYEQADAMIRASRKDAI